MAIEKYGTEVRLQENQIYTVTLKIKGLSYETKFTSRYSPLYSTVRIIRGDYKKLFEQLTDDDILILIRDNSILALELANPSIDTTAAIPHYVNQYVRYKTELDLIQALSLNRAANVNISEKRLGDLQVREESGNMFLKDVMSLAQSRLAAWEAKLYGMTGRPTGAVRAKTNAPYPLSQRRF